MAKEKKPTEAPEKVVEVEEKEQKDSVADEKKRIEDFIARKLKAINQMENEAKARSLAHKVLSNRKG